MWTFRTDFSSPNPNSAGPWEQRARLRSGCSRGSTHRAGNKVNKGDGAERGQKKSTARPQTQQPGAREQWSDTSAATSVVTYGTRFEDSSKELDN